MTDETTTGFRSIPGVTRRHALAGAAIAGVAIPTLAACGSDDTGSEATGTASTDTSTSAPPSSSAAGESSSAAGGSGFATTADIPEGGGAIFADEKIVVTQPTAGEYKGFTNICTHQGCPVADVTDTINCKCHGSKFSITDGSPTQGPATQALAAIDITVDGDSIAKA